MGYLAELLVFFVVAFLAYCALLNRLAYFVHPLRRNLAARCVALCKREDVSGEERRLLAFYMTTMFTGWPMVIVVLAMPVILVYSLARQFRRSVKPMTIRDREMSTICMLHLISVGAANPLLGMVFLAELIVVVTCVALCGGTVVSLERLLVSLEGFLSKRGSLGHEF